MSRAIRFAAVAGILTILYVLAFFSIVPIPLLDEEIKNEILPVIPWWILMTFGSYSLGSLGWGLYTFQDCPDAYNELLSEINAAKNELRMHGVSVD